MNENEWKKAIRCSKEELIEWLNEMYEGDKFQRNLIRKYEEISNVTKVREKYGTTERTIVSVYNNEGNLEFQYFKVNW